MKTNFKLSLMIIPMMSLGFLLINCGDKPEPQITCDSTNTAFLPQELLDRFFFNDGTWWVYHDLLTDLRDSVWLVRSSIGIGKEPELKKNCQQIASFNYKSSTGDAWLVTIQPQSVAGIDKFNDLNYKILYRNTIKNVTIFRFDYKKSIYQNPTEEGGNISFQDSILLGNITLRNILYLEYPKRPIQAEILKKAWYAKDYGLVKYETWDGRVWELANFNIKQ